MDLSKLERGSPAPRIPPEPDAVARFERRGYKGERLFVSFRPDSPDGEFLIRGEIVDHSGASIYPCIGMQFVVAITKHGREYGVSARWVPISA